MRAATARDVRRGSPLADPPARAHDPVMGPSRQSTSMSPRDEAARARWEDEGGRVLSPAPARDAASDPRRVAELPEGYTAQPIEVAHESPFTFELHLVYRPPRQLAGRGAVAALDEGRSHWVVVHTDALERTTTRRLTFASHRERHGGDRFAAFTSLPHMRDELRALVEPRRAPPS